MSFSLAAPGALTRREVCDLPRGIAYDREHDLLHVACADGALVSLDADPLHAEPSRTLELGRDLRDVIVHDGELYVTRFRAAALLRLDASGDIAGTSTPPTFYQTRDIQKGFCGGTIDFERVRIVASPTVSWRAIELPGQGVAMLHQRAETNEIGIQDGGYVGAGLECGMGIIRSALTLSAREETKWSADLESSSLAVDVALSPDGRSLAVASPARSGLGLEVAVYARDQLAEPPVLSANGCARAVSPQRRGLGQVTAVAFASDVGIVAQRREPAALVFLDRDGAVPDFELDLEQPSRADTGHELFHIAAGANIACASCHPEGGDDGHVWTFKDIGSRRTQSLRGGILGSEPLHWNGDMADFGTLMNEVFVGRMRGFLAEPEQVAATAHWIDALPRYEVTARDPEAVERGKALFESEAVGCASCHSGPLLTNSQAAEVGTGALLQVPALRGVSFRTPLMHDGCAGELADRFGECGGGDAHGHTSQLTGAQRNDLTAYLEAL